eukprot:s7437_g1.t1
MLVIDGESGDELEDLSDNVSDPRGMSSNRKKMKKKKKKCRHHHEAAVGSDVEADERMHDHAEDDIDDYAEFDEDERGYSPSVGPDDDDVDHDIEIEEERFRRISGTPRPSRYTPTEWQKMAPDVRKGIAKAEEKKAEAELERKKSEARIKESEDRKKAKEKK